MGLTFPATVVVATYGDDRWADLAWERAMPSAMAQFPAIHAHRDTLAEARNAGLRSVETEWVIHLDADDELEPGYRQAMETGSADLRAPSVRYVSNGRESRPLVPKVSGHRHDCTGDCLPQGNWLVIGTAVRADLLRSVGGWWDEAMYEDYSAWLRCWAVGASVEAVPDAVYRAHIRADSRNRAPSIKEKNRWHYEIVESVLGRAEGDRAA